MSTDNTYRISSCFLKELPAPCTTCGTVKCPSIYKDTEDRKIVKDYSPGPYKRGTSWSDWFRRLKSYFVVANETDEKRQRHIFLLEIGTDNYEILKRQFGGPLPEDQPINFLYWEMGVAIGQRALGYCSPSLQVK